MSTVGHNAKRVGAEVLADMLAGYGVTEPGVGAPIDASMDVTEVGESALGGTMVEIRLPRAAD